MKALLPILLLSIFIFAACGQKNVQRQNTTNEKATSTSTPVEKTEKVETECKICDFDFENYKGELNKEEVNGLLLALNDEYHALATYEQVNKDFGSLRPFVNIRQAEAQHAERLKQVFKTYNVPIPDNKWIGNVPKFQTVTEACKAGVDGEIINRELYKKLFDTTKREDILTVYRALKTASEKNHLPAFERCASAGDG